MYSYLQKYKLFYFVCINMQGYKKLTGKKIADNCMYGVFLCYGACEDDLGRVYAKSYNKLHD